MVSEPPLPIEIDAYLSGSVTNIINNEGVQITARGTFIQGIIGIGGEKQGSELAGAVQEETKYDDSNNLEEVIELDDEKPQASGLLAKAQNLQEKS